MMKDEMKMIFAEALITGNASEAIERSEKREQDRVVRDQRLPRKVNDELCPNEVRWDGIDCNVSVRDSAYYDYVSEKQSENNQKWARKQYELLGIKIINEYDDLFLNVQLPDGWEIKATDHSMWNEVIDNKGRHRMKFFYKGAFYDRDAFTNFNRRYGIDTVSENPEAPYKEQEKLSWFGVVVDHGDNEKELFRTSGFKPSNDTYLYSGKEELANIAKAWLTENYPDWEDFKAYWEE